MRVAVATCLEPPEPDLDEPLFVEALARAGIDARARAWDAAEASWDDVDLCVIRSTWNYHHRLADFLAWAGRVASATRLANPLEVVAWNAHKGYLRDLLARGFPVVPTAWLERGAEASLTSLMGARGWTDVVVKPAVSAGSYATARFGRSGADAGERHVASLLAERDVMVQPFVRSVEEYGERAIVCIDGAPTHAVRKAPRYAGGEARTEAAPMADDERRLAEAILRELGADLLYARVDLVRDEGGRPMLMELELVEPSLFLACSEAALARLVAGVARRARR